MKIYSKGELVEAIVEGVYPFGVFVRLEGGIRGYIRRRELFFSGDQDPQEALHPDMSIRAIVTELATTNQLMELSVRAMLPDPTEDFVKNYQIGDAVIARVRKVTNTIAAVEIQPGVHGTVNLKEFVTRESDKVMDILWEGDLIQAVITHIDTQGERLSLSIRQRIEQLKKAETTNEKLLQKYGMAINETGEAKPIEVLPETNEESNLKIGSILVIEDQDDVRESLVKWLTDQGCFADGVRTAKEALELYFKKSYSLLMVDLDLPEVDGIKFIEQVRSIRKGLTIAVMSEPELLAQQFPTLQKFEVAMVFPKPLDKEEIHRFLIHLSKGEESALSNVIQPFRNLETIMRSGESFSQRIRQGLEQILMQTKAEMGIVFRLDPVSGNVSIEAYLGDILLNQQSLFGLVASPVKDVITERRIIWINQISEQETRRFRNLLKLLPFDSCVGIPIAFGDHCDQALFIFHGQREMFSERQVEFMSAMGALFRVAFESEVLDQKIQYLSRFLLSGQLAAAFSHEINNELSGLDLQLLNLRTYLDSILENRYSLNDPPRLLEIQNELDKAVRIATNLKQTVLGFKGLMDFREGKAIVDINQVISQALNQVEPIARKAGVIIRSRLLESLLVIAGSKSGLYQVFLNLILNSIQHMELSQCDLRLLTVAAHVQTDRSKPNILVRFIDTGPGIHRKLWEQIFDLGFTTKAVGSGLGLYIARSLVESMGGKIFVEESYIKLGTTFCIELPVATET